MSTGNSFFDNITVGYRVSGDDVENEEICTITEVVRFPKLLTGLDPLTSYTVRVQATNSEGMSPFSDEVTFSTFGKQKMTTCCYFEQIVMY